MAPAIATEWPLNNGGKLIFSASKPARPVVRQGRLVSHLRAAVVFSGGAEIRRMASTFNAAGLR